MNKLRKKIIRDLKLYPFSDRFDINYLTGFISKISEEKDFNLLHPFLLLASDFNNLFQESFNQIKSTILSSNLDYDLLTECLISSANRHFIVVSKISGVEGNEHNYEDFFKKKIQSVDTSIGDIDARAALETEIDSLNILFSYLKYFKEELKTSLEDENDTSRVDSIIHMTLTANYYNVIKTSYDDSIFNNGFLEVNKNKLHFKYLNNDELFLGKIGYFRLNRNLSAHHIILKETLEKVNDVRTFFSSFYNNKNEIKRIKKIIIKEGEIFFTLASGHDKQEFCNFIFLEESLRTYYEFVYDVQMPKSEGLSLKDFLILFNMLQSLFNYSLNLVDDDDSVMRIKEFGKFPYKIKTESLKSYLKLKSKYSCKQINYFLNLLTNNIDQRINFWNYPLFKKNGYYLAPLLSVLNPLIFVLSDRWLEDSGFDIEKRGVFFENHIKQKLSNALNEKRYFFKIPKISKFIVSTDVFEEIDLIINLKSICIIAEVKCIKYALNPRDEFNALNRLREGATQVNRKADFIRNNATKFIDKIGDISTKPIIKMVLTNFPSFSGYVLEGVPIVDLYLIEAYIRSGRISNHRLVTNNGKIIENKLEDEEVFYNNEDEFCDNLEGFLFKPDYIEKCRNYYELVANKISVENSFDMYIDSVEFKNI
ncbi:hypothetical protein [Flavobacterium muglaense]|uniref:NERD domain-containing protein n=1 Tax=Flavobacterium muglaense TaxID=2764716 RepID=A0A923MZ47_9FLAO|nr:hypothetical protein [Flavobacterium muglaense]MBC5837570.1 hypothetical protein [Flavobacterium muglaense]MBC5844097.1 hypothetical protein [Flavobacterium muglaense]